MTVLSTVVTVDEINPLPRNHIDDTAEAVECVMAQSIPSATIRNRTMKDMVGKVIKSAQDQDVRSPASSPIDKLNMKDIVVMLTKEKSKSKVSFVFSYMI